MRLCNKNGIIFILFYERNLVFLGFKKVTNQSVGRQFSLRGEILICSKELYWIIQQISILDIII